MKKTFLNVLFIAAIVGCTSPDAVSMDQAPTTMRTVAMPPPPPKPSLRVIGDTIYFLNSPPDKRKPKDFKDRKSINAHYNALSAALRKRDSIQNARFAFNNGIRYLFTSNGIYPHQRNRGNPLGIGSWTEKLCPNLSSLKWLEGVKFYQNPGECDSGVDGKSCFDYVGIADGYMMSWNEEMARLCRGGK